MLSSPSDRARNEDQSMKYMWLPFSNKKAEHGHKISRSPDRSHLTTNMDSAKSRTICNVSEKQSCVSLDVVGRRREKIKIWAGDSRLWIATSFVSKVLLEHGHTHSFTGLSNCILPRAAFELQQPSWVFAIGTTWPTICKILDVGFFIEKVCQSLN